MHALARGPGRGHPPLALLLFLVGVVALAIASLAHAQPADPSQGVPYIHDVMQAAAGHHWRALAALGLVGVVYVARKIGGAIPRVGDWLKTDRGGAVLALVVGVCGAMATTLWMPVHLSVDVIVEGLVVGVMGAGGWTVVRKLLPASWFARAVPAVARAGALLLFVSAGFLSACAASGTDKARQTLAGISTANAAAERAISVALAPHQLALVDASRAACKGTPAPQFTACVQQHDAVTLGNFTKARDRAIEVALTIDAAIAVAMPALDRVDAAGKGQAFDPSPLLGPVLYLVEELQGLLSSMGLLPPSLVDALKVL